MRLDYSDLIDRAARRCWDSGSLEDALEILEPALAARSVSAYKYLIDFLIGKERFGEARHYVDLLLAEAKSDLDLAVVCQMCHSQTFSQLSLDEQAIYRHALFTLAERGNPVVQGEIALNYLRGESGFPKDAHEFERWMRKSVDASEEVDPVCYLVEYLLEQSQPIDVALLKRLERAVEEEPEWAELQALYVRARQCG